MPKATPSVFPESLFLNYGHSQTPNEKKVFPLFSEWLCHIERGYCPFKRLHGSFLMNRHGRAIRAREASVPKRYSRLVQAESVLRPFWRLLLSTWRPPLVAILAMNPILLFRTLFDG